MEVITFVLIDNENTIASSNISYSYEMSLLTNCTLTPSNDIVGAYSALQLSFTSQYPILSTYQIFFQIDYWGSNKTSNLTNFNSTTIDCTNV